MNCEMAEENLSAYLDDMLDPPDRATIQSHLDGCTRCREVLDDYRRYDALLAHMPRMAPPEELRASIFESPEYLALVRDLQRQEQRARAGAGTNGSGRQRTTAPPAWRGIGLQAAAAAAVVLVIGAALLVKQGLFTSPPHAGTSTSTIGKPGQTGVPLTAGSRLVFLHGNALWSAPEVGPGQAQQLTPPGIFVGGFAVSPDGHYVAYVDSIHGALHVIRSDGQSDATIVPGHGLLLDGLAWSPDGQQITYAVNSTSGPVLHLINSSGTNDRVISATGNGTISSFEQIIWSGDALRVAWVQTANGAQSLWMYDLVSHKTHQLASQADPADASTRFRELIWLSDTLHPALSWAAGQAAIPGTVPTGTTSTGLAGASGVFTLALSSGTVQRLTPAGATYAQAQFTAARGGAWLLATAGSPATLQAIAANSGATLATTTVPASVTSGFWSPDGGSVAYVTASGDLAVWQLGNAPVVVLHGAAGFPAWSPDGAHLAVPTSGGVVSVAISSGSSSGSPTHLSGSSAQAPVAAFWAPDGHAVVIVSPSSLVIVAGDGTQGRAVEQGSVTGAMAWSVAG